MNNPTPKQYLTIDGEAVLSRSIRTLQSVPAVDQITVTLDASDTGWPSLSLADCTTTIDTVVGGSTRAESVLAGLQFTAESSGRDAGVLVHDAARPLVRRNDIERLIDSVMSTDVCGGLLAVPATDTLKEVDSGNAVVSTLNRQRIWQAQTPQMFRLGELTDAMTDALASGSPVTDEASAMELRGYKPLIVEGSVDNIKITHNRDLALAALLLQDQCREN